MKALCAQCFKRDAGKHCGKCGCRYCSPECQREHWMASHKQWCGKAGQWGRDFEIRPSPDKQGLGIFALRPFKKYETIAVDRPITVGPHGDIISPTDDRLPFGFAARMQEMVRKGAPKELIDEQKTVNLTICRANSDCLGNARTMAASAKSGRLKLLKAIRDIAQGEEICVPLFDELVMGQRELPFAGRGLRQMVFGGPGYGFQCKCAACTNPEVDAKLGTLKALLKEHDKVTAPLDLGKIKENAKKMVALADELGCSPAVYYHIYSKLHFAVMCSGQFYAQKEEMNDVTAKIKEICTQWFEPDSHEAKYGEYMAMTGTGAAVVMPPIKMTDSGGFEPLY